MDVKDYGSFKVIRVGKLRYASKKEDSKKETAKKKKDN